MPLAGVVINFPRERHRRFVARTFVGRGRLGADVCRARSQAPRSGGWSARVARGLPGAVRRNCGWECRNIWMLGHCGFYGQAPSNAVVICILTGGSSGAPGWTAPPAGAHRKREAAGLGHQHKVVVRVCGHGIHLSIRLEDLPEADPAGGAPQHLMMSTGHSYRTRHQPPRWGAPVGLPNGMSRVTVSARGA